MLFNSLTFLVFLFIVLTLHWTLKGKNQRNILLLISSYVFYGWWSYKFLTLILFTSFACYLLGKLIEEAKRTEQKKKLLHASIALNLGTLFVFKYFNFFAAEMSTLLNRLGFEPDWATLYVVLPVGISFYTFQALGYTLDVYKGNIPSCKNPVTFFLYISFFPQLVAGPIERAGRLIPQINAQRKFDYHKAVQGMRYILIGYIYKLVLADNFAVMVDRVYDQITGYSASSLVLATYGFAFQIYGDFAGYSFIAIGVAMLFGIDLMTNFKSPYLSESIKEFWKRWHISLSSWIRDYFYIMFLKGNRVSKWRKVYNVIVTFTVIGFWHGANWTFMFWGVLNGMMYYIGKPFKGNNKISSLINIIICFNMACIGWIFFRARNITDGFHTIGRILCLSDGDELSAMLKGSMGLAIAAVIGFEYIQRDKKSIVDVDQIPPVFRNGLYVISLLLIFFVGNFENKPFVYFQF